MIELGTSWEVGLTAAAAAFQHTYYLLGRSVAESEDTVKDRRISGVLRPYFRIPTSGYISLFPALTTGL